jgi:type II secretory pathway pseudopilin PulG
MKLAGQASRSNRTRNPEYGYAMAALLVAMSVMAIMMTAVMPVWRHQAQREKEDELVFRGLQYVHAIGLFQRKFANAYPPTVDVLVEQRFLRKKFKDPITNDDFALIPAGGALPGATPAAGNASGGRGTSPSSAPSPTSGSASGGAASGQVGSALRNTASIGTPGAAGAVTGISGVTSKSKDASIRIYNGRSHYNEWAFVYVATTQAPGAGGAGGPGGRGTGQPGPNGPGGVGGVGGRGRGPNGPGAPGSPNGPGGRGFGPGPMPIQPLFPPPPGRGH